MTDPMTGESQDTDVALRGSWGLNNSIITQSIQPDFTLNPGPVDDERDVVIGSAGTPAVYNENTGGYDLTGQKYSFETARMVRYRAGGLQFAGSMLVIPDDPPAGHLDFGLGRVPFQAWRDSGTFAQDDGEILLRLTSNGDWAFVIRRNDVETIIPRKADAASWQGTPAEGRSWDPSASKSRGIDADDQAGNLAGRFWGFDRVDGQGPGNGNPSGVDLDQRPLAVLPKIIGTWYGKGPFFITFEAAGPGGYQRPWRAAAFEAVGQSISTAATQPLTIRYDDDGAGQSYDVEVYGRQGSGSGGIGTQPKTPWEFLDSAGYGSGFGNAELLMAYRRSPEDVVASPVNFKGTTFGLLDVEVYTDQRSIVFTALDPDFGGQTPAWGNPTSIDEAQDSVVQVATQDDAAGDLTADPTTGTLQSAEMVGASSVSGGGSTVASLMPVDQPNPRTKPVGIFAFSSTGQAASGAEVKVQFQEEGA